MNFTISTDDSTNPYSFEWLPIAYLWPSEIFNLAGARIRPSATASLWLRAPDSPVDWIIKVLCFSCIVELLLTWLDYQCLPLLSAEITSQIQGCWYMFTDPVSNNFLFLSPEGWMTSVSHNSIFNEVIMKAIRSSPSVTNIFVLFPAFSAHLSVVLLTTSWSVSMRLLRLLWTIEQVWWLNTLQARSVFELSPITSVRAGFLTASLNSREATSWLSIRHPKCGMDSSPHLYAQIALFYWFD